jgi:hypothetical protein
MLQAIACPQPQLQLYALHLGQVERTAARLVLRQALAQLISQRYGHPVQACSISNLRGQAPTWQQPPDMHLHQNLHQNLHIPVPPLQLSFSYEGDWAVCAVYQGRGVGIDLVRLPLAQWQSQTAHWRQLMADYLDPQDVKAILQTPAGQQMEAFVQAWARHEARLKCLGQPLQEWQAERAWPSNRVHTGLVGDLPWAAQDPTAVWALAWACD